ncbi:uncharacterized protein NECHADRAFT_81233 [Fusarium vanettenii 77-13-4]|uniref:Uncharacterized protein n=1 Tax=Fusarium vanettenii (strain ATCC MYA-4622 / CBS 123669 / FGSC 9596 / NRRL 45880 / 77-13-4) TaxID=660122 RepID=C7ZHG3_FUSV7|nr:uncharacterized protein NECHADRAFT_81233 [Fusarium vanettenii 77-13-4]EEU36538.1 predicted protein [Fusarium vanettenii 77-13-4]
MIAELALGHVPTRQTAPQLRIRTCIVRFASATAPFGIDRLCLEAAKKTKLNGELMQGTDNLAKACWGITNGPPAEPPPSISSPRIYDANLGPTRAILAHSHLSLRLFVGCTAQEGVVQPHQLLRPEQPGETGAESSVHHIPPISEEGPSSQSSRLMELYGFPSMDHDSS